MYRSRILSAGWYRGGRYLRTASPALWRDDLTQAAVGAVDQDAAEAADFGGDGYGCTCLVRVILYHVQKYFFWGTTLRAGRGTGGLRERGIGKGAGRGLADRGSG